MHSHAWPSGFERVCGAWLIDVIWPRWARGDDALLCVDVGDGGGNRLYLGTKNNEAPKGAQQQKE